MSRLLIGMGYDLGGLGDARVIDFTGVWKMWTRGVGRLFEEVVVEMAGKGKSLS